MKAYKRNYVGKGTQVEKMNIVKVTLKMDDLVNHKHEYKGHEYVTIEVAKLQNPDKFGRTHTAYVSTREETAETENNGSDS